MLYGQRSSAARVAAIIAAPILLTLGGGGCSEKCETTSGLFEPLREAMIYPERFDQWLRDHPAYFDGARDACMGELMDRAAQIGEVLHRQCDETFIEGDDWWLQCHSEVQQDNFVKIWSAIRATTRGQVRFTQTAVGQQLIGIKQVLGDEYEVTFQGFFQRFEKPLRESLTCEKCETHFLFF